MSSTRGALYARSYHSGTCAAPSDILPTWQFVASRTSFLMHVSAPTGAMPAPASHLSGIFPAFRGLSRTRTSNLGFWPQHSYCSGSSLFREPSNRCAYSEYYEST